MQDEVRNNVGNIGNINDYNKFANDKFSHQNLKLENPISEKEGGVSLLSAISQIQRYYVIESRTDEIPKEYFSIGQIWHFFKIGFKSGLVESMLFVSLMPLLQVVYPYFKNYFLQSPITKNEQLFFILLSYSPIVFSTIFMFYISRYYEGELTKRAIFSLLNGRSLSFIFKGVLFYALLQYAYFYSFKNPNSIYVLAHWTVGFFNLFHDMNTQQLYIFYFKYIIPTLQFVAKEILISMLVFAALPYLIVFYKGFRNKKAKINNQRAYDEY
ncbi:hypothetical protein [Campylobacter upsaliensis]|uniref:Uncharacterized protein n=1 Tax=Campylobacter upsaliensis TaxID=28080 RepID=A0A381F3F7_CAMUP|nr:hypothetical protein [Campylobacter upsaliensis]SUX41091.1 Uncharacterised protein [Campylobacter upsaliensis]